RYSLNAWFWPNGRARPARSAFQNASRCYGDAKPFQADIVTRARGDELDRDDAEIAQNLGAQPDLAPFVLPPAGLFVAFPVLCGAVEHVAAHAHRTLAQIDDDPAVLFSHDLHDPAQLVILAEHVRDDVLD